MSNREKGVTKMSLLDKASDCMSMQEYLEKVATFPTLAMLKSYQSQGYLSRTFMLREHGKMLDDVRKGIGVYATYTNEHKEFVEVRVYLELFERLCQSIEDFTSITHGLTGELRNMPKNVLNSPSPATVLKKLDRATLYRILQYAPIDTLDLDEEEKRFLATVREQSTDVLLKFIKVLSKFLDHFWIVYTKLKHTQISIMQGSTPLVIEGEKMYWIPAIYNPQQPDQVKGIFVNNFVYGQWKTIFNAVNTISKEIVDRTVQVIECQGIRISEYATFHFITESEQSRISQIITKCVEGVQRTNVNIQVNSNIPTDKMVKQLNFYNFDLGAFPSSKQA